MIRKAVWLDCDPGHDDALAIILAGFTPSVCLLGISTTAGNQSASKCTDNALRVVSFFGLDCIQVVKGQGRPLIREPMHCPEIHGDSGLDCLRGGHALPVTDKKAEEGKAVVRMFEAIKTWHDDHKGQRVAVVGTAALTNIALLLILYPEVIEMIEIVFMGGALGVGNTGPVVEFNIQVDPEACHVVLESGCPVTMVPLEVTHTALCTASVLKRIRDIDESDPRVQAVIDLLLYFAQTYKQVFQFDDPPTHDPCAVAFVIAPEIFTAKMHRVDVELCSTLSSGQTVVDIWDQRQDKRKNVLVCHRMDVDAFWDLMITAIQKCTAKH